MVQRYQNKPLLSFLEEEYFEVGGREKGDLSRCIPVILSCCSALQLNTSHGRAEIVAGDTGGSPKEEEKKAIKPYLFLASCSMFDAIDFKNRTGPGSLVFTFLNFRKSNFAVIAPHVIPLARPFQSTTRRSYSIEGK